MKIKIPKFIVDYLINKSFQTPYAHLSGYMNRWWLVPYSYIPERKEDAIGCGPVSFFKRPIAWILQQFGIAIRVHEILSSDAADEYHDHPWNYTSVILKGEYIELIPLYNQSNLFVGGGLRFCEEGDILFRKADHWHRLKLIDNEPCWTLFITGPKIQSWGFLTKPDYKTYYRDFLADPKGQSRGRR